VVKCYTSADGVNLIGHNIGTMKKNMKTEIDDSKEVGLKVNLR
jgi:hypothetical protein